MTRDGPATLRSARGRAAVPGERPRPWPGRSSSGGMSPASSISPSVTTTTGRLEAAAAVSAGRSSDRPRLGHACRWPRPRRRTCGHRPRARAESRASAQRPAGRGHAERAVEQHERPLRARRRRAADVEKEETDRRPGDCPRETSGSQARRPSPLEPEIGERGQRRPRAAMTRAGGEHQPAVGATATSSAWARSNTPSYSARPTIAPASPASAIRRRSSSEETPPLAITCAPSRCRADGARDVGPLEHAVPRDVGVDQGGDAGSPAPGCASSAAVSARGLGPSADRHLPVARVHPGGEPLRGHRRRRGGEEAGVHRGRGADHDAVGAELEPAAHQVERAESRRRAGPGPGRQPARARRRTAASLSPSPKARSRSTTWIHRAPCSANRSATAAGPSHKRFAASPRPGSGERRGRFGCRWRERGPRRAAATEATDRWSPALEACGDRRW